LRLRQKYERLLKPAGGAVLTEAQAAATLNVIRRLILLEGLPPLTTVRRALGHAHGGFGSTTIVRHIARARGPCGRGLYVARACLEGAAGRQRRLG
jgi:hypothetical protein